MRRGAAGVEGLPPASHCCCHLMRSEGDRMPMFRQVRWNTMPQRVHATAGGLCRRPAPAVPWPRHRPLAQRTHPGCRQWVQQATRGTWGTWVGGASMRVDMLHFGGCRVGSTSGDSASRDSHRPGTLPNSLAAEGEENTSRCCGKRRGI